MKTILVIGSGALKVGEAGEFDYSGSQAVKAIHQCGHRAIVLNPNVASTQSNNDFAYLVFSKPITSDEVESIFLQHQVDAVMISFGGQTALNCGIQCEQEGIFEKYRVEVLGTQIEDITISESRLQFARLVQHLNYETSNYYIVEEMSQLRINQNSIDYPVFVRSSESLGGLASKVCNNELELIDHCEQTLNFSKSLIIEEYLHGYKEVEYEVLRDYKDNCISVCNMENMDPIGIHTGDSIVVAPSQTINDKLHQRLRNAAFDIARNLKVIGECNVQFAINPLDDSFKVIEVNARLSRSSALASKASAYPIALIAAKLCMGYGLWELKNSLIGHLSAVMEPSFDYVCVKIPKWEDTRYFGKEISIGPEMQSVGEVMAIGRTFEEAIQKSIRMAYDSTVIDSINLTPSSKRVLHLLNFLRQGHSLKEIQTDTQIQYWFLGRLLNIVDIETKLKNTLDFDEELIRVSKSAGFSDEQLGYLLNKKQQEIRSFRIKHKIIPSIKMIDSVSGEYEAQSNYLYHSYNGLENDVVPLAPNKSVLIIGSGAYHVGSSIEFDWCCTQSLKCLKQLGYKSIFINHNPETLSTDYDECDRLYFEELNFEKTFDIIEFEKPMGVIVSMCGQVGNNLSKELNRVGVKLLGSSFNSIENCENREKFSSLLSNLKIRQATSVELHDSNIKYPVIVRPSSIMSGVGMTICADKSQLLAAVSNQPAAYIINEMVQNAKEVEFDAVAYNNEILEFAISEQIEAAGVHSGDSSLICPPVNISKKIKNEILTIGKRLVKSLTIQGVFNLQFMVKDEVLLLIECNLRASRAIPFVSKVLDVNFIAMSIQIYLNDKLLYTKKKDLEYYGVKVPQFSFQRMKNLDPTLGVVMKSTGEVACFSSHYLEALFDAMIAVGYPKQVKKILVHANKLCLLKDVDLASLRVDILCIDSATSENLNTLKIDHQVVSEKSLRFDIDLFLCISTIETKHFQRKVIDHGVPLINNQNLAKEYIKAINMIEASL